MSDRPLVLIESPFAGDLVRNISYGTACILDSISRGEAPIASHMFYTRAGLLRDEIPEERQIGMEIGFSWLRAVEFSAVYTDLGISPGMEKGIKKAAELNVPIFYRSIY